MRFTRRIDTDLNVKYIYFLFLFNLTLILIIFAVYLPKFSASAGLSVELARAIVSEPVAKNDFIVSILSNNALYLDSKRITPDELTGFFRSRKRGSFKVLIKVDQRASVGILVRVWDILRESGASSVYIAANES